MLARLLLLLCGCLIALPAHAQPHQGDGSATDGGGEAAQGQAFVPNIEPSLTVPRVASPITLDGRLTEAAWQRAARATNFAETFPGDQTRPPIETTAYLAYDDTYLYVGFVVEDDPAAIRASLSDRDRIWSDDYVGLMLDTNGDGQQIYFIAANPLGVQGDTRSSHQGEDISFDLVYDAEAQLTDEGYEVELRVPFRSLRFPRAEVQTWRGTFWITHPRESRSQYTWAAMDRDDPCMSCQLGTFTGIQGVSSGKNLEVMPAVTGSQFSERGAADAPFEAERLTAEPSLNVKYGLTSDLTADLTLNPDFSQIEADAAQIDVNSTTALFFPERRAFFQEGSELFATPIQTVYTRSINNPAVAAKMTGRFGRTSVGFIGARDVDSPILVPFEERSALVDGGRSVSNILRVQHNFEDNSYVGALLTDRRLDEGGAGTTVGLDGTWRFLTKYQLRGQAVLSRTAEPDAPALSEGFADETLGDGAYTAAFDGETFQGHALKTRFARNARHWSFNVDYESISPTFRAANGFIGQNSRRSVFFWQGYTFYPERLGFLDRIRPAMHTGAIWNFDGVRKDIWIMPNLWLQFKHQTNLTVRYVASTERFRDENFPGIRRISFDVDSNFSEPVKLGFSMTRGRTIARTIDDPELGRTFDLRVRATLRPTQRLLLEPVLSYSELTDRDTGEAFFSGYIARTRVNYQFSRRLFTRLVVQYNDFAERLEVDPLITYRINPFSAFYVGSTHDYITFDAPGVPGDPAATVFAQSRRQFFFKFQYLVRV